MFFLSLQSPLCIVFNPRNKLRIKYNYFELLLHFLAVEGMFLFARCVRWMTMKTDLAAIDVNSSSMLVV